MKLTFANRALMDAAVDRSKAVREWGPNVGRRYGLRIAQLANAPDFQSLFSLRSLRLHRLTGDRRDTFAITLHGRWRIILSHPSEDEIRVQEVTNHYGD